MKKQPVDEHQTKIQCIRITLSSTNVESLTKVASAVVKNSKADNLRVRGPVPLPVKKIKITTRKTPCGEGSKTWECYSMIIHKRLIDLFCPQDQVSTLRSITIEPDVISEVIVRDV